MCVYNAAGTCGRRIPSNARPLLLFVKVITLITRRLASGSVRRRTHTLALLMVYTYAGAGVCAYVLLYGQWCQRWYNVRSVIIPDDPETGPNGGATVKATRTAKDGRHRRRRRRCCCCMVKNGNTSSGGGCVTIERFSSRSIILLL